jgi:hypothetical protein
MHPTAPEKNARPSERPSDENQSPVWSYIWLIGLPLPVLFVLFLIRGCT